jgi:hypothetical protein
VSGHPLAGLLRTRVLARIAARAMRRPSVQRLVFRFVSQIQIGYRGSALSHTQGAWPGDAPQAGDRFPWLKLVFAGGADVEDLFERLDDTRWTLLVFGQPAPTTALPVLMAAADPRNDQTLASVHIPQPSFFVLRPDGYIGLCGTALASDTLARYFTQCLGDRAG